MEAITDVKGLRNGLEQLEATLDARHLNQRQQRHRFFWQEFVKQANFMPFLYGSGDLAVRYRSRSGELQLFDQGKMKVHSTSAFDFDQEVRAYLEQKLQDFQTLSAKEKCRRILKHSRIDIDFTKKQHSYMVAPSTWVLSESIDFDATLQLLQTQNRKALLQYLPYQFFWLLGYTREEVFVPAFQMDYPQPLWEEHQALLETLRFAPQALLVDRLLRSYSLGDEWQPFASSFYRAMPQVKIRRRVQEGIHYLEFLVEDAYVSSKGAPSVELSYNVTYHHPDRKYQSGSWTSTSNELGKQKRAVDARRKTNTEQDPFTKLDQKDSGLQGILARIAAIFGKK